MTSTTLIAGPWWPLLALATPLALAALAGLPRVRQHALLLLPLAPLPALPLAVVGTFADATTVPDLLLGVHLGLDDSARPFLLLTAWLWLMAGLYAATYLRNTRKPAVFTSFWCMTLAGNLGVFMAQDVATFYLAFATVSLAAYVLVVHDGTERALHAGRIYLILALLGEAALLGGLLMGAHAADSPRIIDVRAALGEAPSRHVIIALLVLGFGLKAGLMPLHIWLPLAHPAAPTPASAVLSGAIVKAGIFGLMAFLPGGAQAMDWGWLLLVAGLLSAYGGVLLGLTQSDVKAVLAYSTISQMGLVIALIGLSMTQAHTAPALTAAALASVHHGLAKGALFLAVGVALATTGRPRHWVLALTALAALSVAGLPLTGGAWAKAALKAPVDIEVVEWLLALSATGTALLLLRFWLLLRAKKAEHTGNQSGVPWGLLLPWITLLGSALLLPWVLVPYYTGMPSGYALAPGTLWSGVWPLLLAGALAAVALRRRMKPPTLPEGDLAHPLERAVLVVVRAVTVRAMAERPQHARRMRRWLEQATNWQAFERALSRWSVAGVVLLFVMLAVTVLTRVGSG
ncbi:complex I subunit 5 family protein [Hydrogenophaga sp.]|uniref:complex I subunit 5 family protein n=1 Tax=Hydrogenophaga sp. TaxID=1904254 RepID=UPI00271B9F98|nr:complex I subunit 5 family protein [Hydrogenophaga sp.]MDO8904815.1 complex I subunit 5 family protein [Hydrogenophaga sp.]